MRRSTILVLVLCGLILAAIALILHRAGAPAEGHITLLTVSEDVAGTGGTADLYLTVKPGTGAVYMDSFPLTRVDTQGSMRYANRLACDMLEIDCSQYDFFYKIRANSAIVGGPSAGGAMTVLTVAVLDGKRVDQHTAMTGTINSGGIIGPVAGVDAKVKGAKRAGMTRVLVPAILSPQDISAPSPDENSTSPETEYEPMGEGSGPDDLPDTVDSITNPHAVNTTDSNDTASDEETETPVAQIPLSRGRIDSLSDNDITVVGVGTVEDALFFFTGKNYSHSDTLLTVPSEYATRMDSIADEICDRMNGLEDVVRTRHLDYNDTHNYTNRIAAVDVEHDYSRASLCFSKNIELATLVLQDYTRTDRRDRLTELREQADELENETRARNITTIGDLEAYAIVIERVLEAQELLHDNDAREPANLAYAQERLVSAKSWSRFFGVPGRTVDINDEHLRVACLAKLAEAEERINYVRLYAPQLLDDSEEAYTKAEGYARDEPVLCIFTAAKAKAQADVLGAAVTIGQENVDALLTQKIDAAKRALSREQEEGFFPILGYSYAQYAQDLQGTASYSGLIFSEYALELSNLDMYFPQPKEFDLSPLAEETLAIFIFGALFGAAIVLFIVGRSPTHRVTRKDERAERKAKNRRVKRS